MPSSLVTRMRACRRSAGGDLTFADVGAVRTVGLSALRLVRRPMALLTGNLLPTMHIGPQDFGNGDRPVLLLIGLHDGDQRAADRDPRAVQRVHEARALLARLAGPR